MLTILIKQGRVALSRAVLVLAATASLLRAADPIALAPDSGPGLDTPNAPWMCDPTKGERTPSLLSFMEEDPLSLDPQTVAQRVAEILNVDPRDAALTSQQIQLREEIEKSLEIASPPGTPANGKPTWRNPGLIFQSENKDFLMHLGARIEVEALWWQPMGLKGAPSFGTFGTVQVSH
jgi:hypothetical protein